MNYTKGIDLAVYEPRVNWQAVQEADYHFAFIKASQADWIDGKFAEHWTNSKKDGMPRGAYHFYDPRWNGVTPQKQAEHFWSLIENDPGELPMVIDIEAYTSGYYVGSDYWYQYLERLKQLSGGKEIAIYTAYYFWINNVKRPKAVLNQNYFLQCPLWIAGYGVSTPKVPLWDTWTFWQWADHNVVPGVTDDYGRPTACDQDYFNGDLNQFKQRFNLDGMSAPTGTNPPPIVIPPTGDTVSTTITKYFTTTDTYLCENADGSGHLSTIKKGTEIFPIQKLATTYQVAGGYVKTRDVRTETVTIESPPPTPDPTTKTVKHTFKTFDDGSVELDGTTYP